MTIAKVAATIRCDGCAKPFEVSFDPAMRLGVLSGYDSLDQLVDAHIRGEIATSIQGEHQLCEKCTRTVDNAYPDKAPADLTYDHVKRALDKAVGI